jgi:hypothetical protein
MSSLEVPALRLGCIGVTFGYAEAAQRIINR